MKIHIPSALRPYAGGKASVDGRGATVGECLRALANEFPDLRKNIFTDQGEVRQFVGVYLNEDDVRFLPQRLDSPVRAQDEITILPSIAGGRSNLTEIGSGDTK
jgi:molybdopterin converting factor small subunit